MRGWVVFAFAMALILRIRKELAVAWCSNFRGAFLVLIAGDDDDDFEDSSRFRVLVSGGSGGVTCASGGRLGFMISGGGG